MANSSRFHEASVWDERVGHYVVSKDVKRPNPKEVVEVTRPGKLPSKDYPFRQGHGYSKKEKSPDCGWTRLVVCDLVTGFYSWPRPRDVWYIGTDPKGEPVLSDDPPILKNMTKVEGLTLLCEDLLLLFWRSHCKEYGDDEINETLQPYRERLHKIKNL